MANTRAIAELWSTNVTRTVMATRGRNLSLARVTFSRGDGVEAFLTEMLSVLEISADERISAIVVFDLDDIDAAFEELDARYLAGEAAAYAHTWSVIAGAYAALNRHEIPAPTPDLVNIDHRGETMFGPGDLIAYLRARLDFEQDFNIYTEAVHRLTDLGAVVTYAAHGDLARGFRGRVARGLRFRGRRRHGQPLGSLRRGRPGRRYREVRGTQPAGCAAGKRCDPGV